MYDTIFAPVTSIGPSAISVFRVSGNKSSNILKELIKSKKLPKERKLVLKKIYYPRNKKKILDICLICWMPKPNSFTGEDCFEVHCHGGALTGKAFISVFSEIKGLRFAEAGEFSQRALINGKTNLIKAEAINEIITAETEEQRSLSMRKLNKGLTIPISSWRYQIINILSKIEATIDFSDEDGVPVKIDINKDLKKIMAQIKGVLKEGDKMDLISRGMKVAFTGRPNSGKSSLFNSIIKKEKSIVTKIPGTTRDVIEKKINYKGYPITFSDTAGIRKTKNLVEKEGIKKAMTAVKEADLVLNINDITKVRKKEKTKELNAWNIYNKIDKVNENKKIINTEKNKTFYVSAKTGKGIEGLLEAIHAFMLKKTKKSNESDYFYTNVRQKRELEKALNEIYGALSEKNEEIIAEHLRTSVNNLERILGKIDIEDVLGNIFSNFCIGK